MKDDTEYATSLENKNIADNLELQRVGGKNIKWTIETSKSIPTTKRVILNNNLFSLVFCSSNEDVTAMEHEPTTDDSVFSYRRLPSISRITFD